jgi:hypothetical protein
MITVKSSTILRAYPIMPALTFWQRIIKRFGRLDKEPKTKLFHYDFILEVEDAIELTRHDIVMLRKGIKIIVTSVNQGVVRAFTYQKIERIKDGELNGQGVVIAHGKV